MEEEVEERVERELFKITVHIVEKVININISWISICVCDLCMEGRGQPWMLFFRTRPLHLTALKLA